MTCLIRGGSVKGFTAGTFISPHSPSVHASPDGVVVNLSTCRVGVRKRKVKKRTRIRRRRRKRGREDSEDDNPQSRKKKKTNESQRILKQSTIVSSAGGLQLGESIVPEGMDIKQACFWSSDFKGKGFTEFEMVTLDTRGVRVMPWSLYPEPFKDDCRINLWEGKAPLHNVYPKIPSQYMLQMQCQMHRIGRQLLGLAKRKGMDFTDFENTNFFCDFSVYFTPNREQEEHPTEPDCIVHYETHRVYYHAEFAWEVEQRIQHFIECIEKQEEPCSEWTSPFLQDLTYQPLFCYKEYKDGSSDLQDLTKENAVVGTLEEICK